MGPHVSKIGRVREKELQRWAGLAPGVAGGSWWEAQTKGEHGERPAFWGAPACDPLGQKHVPVHDCDVRLLVIKQLLPQALGQQIHTLLLHRPAAREGTGTWALGPAAILGHLPGWPDLTEQETLIKAPSHRGCPHTGTEHSLSALQGQFPPCPQKGIHSEPRVACGETEAQEGK